MMELDPTPAQVRSRLISAAQRIIDEHWPAANGLCPVCRFVDCLAIDTAYAYLYAVNEPYLPATRWERDWKQPSYGG